MKAGKWVVVHAAAGGVGSLLTQWAKNIGAHVIGTVGSDEKAARAKANGCDHVIVYTRDDVVAGVKEATKGHMADVVYDAVGKATVKASLESLHDNGHLVGDYQMNRSIRTMITEPRKLDESSLWFGRARTGLLQLLGMLMGSGGFRSTMHAET